MPPALYADYVTELRTILTELDQRPEIFQTFDAHLELTAGGSVVVYETKRAKGLTDSLYYGRSARTGETIRMAQETAFAAIDRFLGLGQFLGLSGSLPLGQAVDAAFPMCAVRFAYRKKGQPKARSMLMVLIGFNDDADALAYAAGLDDPSMLVTSRPFQGDRAHEWK